MKKGLLGLFVATLLLSCQKNISEVNSIQNQADVTGQSAAKTTLLNTVPEDVTSSFYDLLDYPVNIIVKENNDGNTYLTCLNQRQPLTFDKRKNDSTQTFFLQKLPSGDLEIYVNKYLDPVSKGRAVPSLIDRRQPQLGENLQLEAIGSRIKPGWKIFKGGTIHDNSYILRYTQTDNVLGSTLTASNTYISPYSNTGRQEFEIRPVDDFELIDIEYTNDASATITQQPDFITQWFYSNNTSVQQSMSTSFSKRATETSSFSQTTGGSISLGASLQVKVGVPVVDITTSINTNISMNHSATYGKNETWEDAQTYNFPINVAPRTSVTATATVGRYLIDIKYKATMRGINTGKLLVVNGVWEGVSCTAVRVDVDEYALNSGQLLNSAKLNKIPKSAFSFQKR